MWQHILKSWPRSILEKVNFDETSSPCDRVTHPLCSISLRQTSKVAHKLAPWQICAWSALPKKREMLSLSRKKGDSAGPVWWNTSHPFHSRFASNAWCIFKTYICSPQNLLLHFVAWTMWACLLECSTPRFTVMQQKSVHYQWVYTDLRRPWLFIFAT